MKTFRFGVLAAFAAATILAASVFSFAGVETKTAGGMTILENSEQGIRLEVDDTSGMFHVYRHGKLWMGDGLVAVRPGEKMLLNARRGGEPSGSMELLGSETGSGTGGSGKFDSVTLKWKAAGLRFDTAFRVYDSEPIIEFSHSFPEGYSAGKKSRFEDTALNFPVFAATGDVQELYLYSYSYRIWPSPVFGKNVRKTFRGWEDGANRTPLMIMDEEGGSAVLSPLGDYLIRIVRVLDLDGQGFAPAAAVGLNGELERLDPGHGSRSILVFDDGGPNSALMAYGSALLRDSGKKPLANDSYYFLKYIGYWTDNGAYYYYRTEEGKDYETTLLDMREYLKEEEIPLKYFQMDSWWYPKSELDNGVLVWEPREDMFPGGFEPFQAKLGLPLTFHNRYFAVDTPYQDRFEFVKDYKNPDPGEGATGGKGELRGVHPATRDIFDLWAGQVDRWGGVMYEQDWLGTQMDRVAQLRSDPDLADNWMSWMADAMDRKGLDIQYCMPTMGFYLESTKFQNVSNIRSSNDYQVRLGGRSNQLWWEHVYTSPIIWALGVYPFKDVIITNPPGKMEKNPVLRNLQGTTGDKYEEGITLTEPFYHQSALLSILSAGPVGVGDRKGDVNKPIVMLMADEKGVLVKPDAPMAPIDRMYYTDTRTSATALTGYTTSTAGGSTWYYVLGLNVTEAMAKAKFELTSEDINTGGRYVAYDFTRKRALALGEDFTIKQNLDALDFMYIVLAPMTGTGRALIGDTGKYVTASSGRIKDWSDAPEAMEIDLAGPEGSETQLLIYTKDEPSRVVDVTRGAEIKKVDKAYIGTAAEGWSQVTRDLALIKLPGGDGVKVRVEF